MITDEINAWPGDAGGKHLSEYWGFGPRVRSTHVVGTSWNECEMGDFGQIGNYVEVLEILSGICINVMPLLEFLALDP